MFPFPSCLTSRLVASKEGQRVLQRPGLQTRLVTASGAFLIFWLLILVLQRLPFFSLHFLIELLRPLVNCARWTLSLASPHFSCDSTYNGSNLPRSELISLPERENLTCAAASCLHVGYFEVPIVSK